MRRLTYLQVDELLDATSDSFANLAGSQGEVGEGLGGGKGGQGEVGESWPSVRK